jgi:hypothetical protein
MAAGVPQHRPVAAAHNPQRHGPPKSQGLCCSRGIPEAAAVQLRSGPTITQSGATAREHPHSAMPKPKKQVAPACVNCGALDRCRSTLHNPRSYPKTRLKCKSGTHWFCRRECMLLSQVCTPDEQVRIIRSEPMLLVHG